MKIKKDLAYLCQIFVIYFKNYINFLISAVTLLKEAYENKIPTLRSSLQLTRHKFFAPNPSQFLMVGSDKLLVGSQGSDTLSALLTMVLNGLNIWF